MINHEDLSKTVPVPNSIVTEHEVANAGDLGQVQRDGVVRAEHPQVVGEQLPSNAAAAPAGSPASPRLNRRRCCGRIRVCGWSGPSTRRLSVSSCPRTPPWPRPDLPPPPATGRRGCGRPQGVRVVRAEHP